jgi:hypothetical protein
LTHLGKEPCIGPSHDIPPSHSQLLTFAPLFVSYAARSAAPFPFTFSFSNLSSKRVLFPMTNKIKPALIGGVVVGLLSAIPFVNLVNICCCLWAILGGGLATYLYVRESATPVRAGEGAILGGLAGLVGGLIYIVIGIPLSILLSGTMNGIILGLVQRIDPAQAEMMRQVMEADQSILSAIVGGIISAVLLVVFSTIGGLLGVPIFEKRKDAPLTPPQPQGFGPGPGGPYGTGL